MNDEKIELVDFKDTRQYIAFRYPFYEFCNRNLHYTMILSWIEARRGYLIQKGFNFYNYKVECSVKTVQETFQFGNKKILEALHFLHEQKLINLTRIPHAYLGGRFVHVAELNVREVNRRLDIWREENNKNYHPDRIITEKQVEELAKAMEQKFPSFI